MLGIYIDRSRNISIEKQIYNQLRSSIIDGELNVGYCLPPTRQLAAELKVSRNTVVDVYDQLVSEGFLESHPGSCTYVSEGILRMKSTPDQSGWEEKKSQVRAKSDIIDFMSGIPDLSMFPVRAWQKCFKAATEYGTGDPFNYGTVFGDPELREQIARYVYTSKGIACSPEYIMIVSGASEGFLLIAKALSAHFKEIHMEDPSVDFVRDIFLNFDYGIKTIDIDQEGACIKRLTEDEAKKLVFLTPSNQFPTGSILTIQRKQAVIKWAETTDSLIIEDDYDSEFRYRGIVIPPLLTMDYSRVIYVGTFSKNLSPGLRLGYVIVPPQLKEVFKKMKSDLNIFSSQLEQKTLAKFIGQGSLERHIYKMKKVYQEKQLYLTRQLRDFFGDSLGIKGNDAGMHLVVEFGHRQIHEGLEWTRASDFGVRVHPLEEFYYLKPSPDKKARQKIIMGYGNLSLNDIKNGIDRLYRFVESYRN